MQTGGGALHVACATAALANQIASGAAQTQFDIFATLTIIPTGGLTQSCQPPWHPLSGNMASTPAGPNQMRRNVLAIREPAGRIQRDQSKAAQEFSPTQIKRLRDAAIRQMAEPEWGSELGRLFLNRAITPAQYAAGKRWRYIATKYHHQIGVRELRSQSFEKSHGKAVEGDSNPSSITGRREQRTENDFISAHTKLNSISSAAERITRALCERDEPCAGAYEKRLLIIGLTTLAKHWKLRGS